MLFGLPEMKVFAETSSDPRIKALWARLKEARKKNALWCEEVNTLREQLRWRKWPEEKPEGKDEYMTIIDDEGNDDTCLLFWNGSEFCLRGGFRPLVSYWRPIGELPGDTE